MIDLAAARARADWLAELKPWSPVTLHTVTGVFPAAIWKIHACPYTGKDRFWLRVCRPNSNMPIWDVWVWRDTGDCPGARIHIEPADALVPSIGGDDQAQDAMVGGWEAV